MLEETLVRRFYRDLWNARDPYVAAEILSPGLTFRGSLGPEHRGIDGFLGYMEGVHESLGDYTCTIEDLVAEPGKAAARMRFAGIHRAPFLSFAPTGRAIHWQGAAFFAIEAGLIADIWVLGDIAALRERLASTNQDDLNGQSL